jgi:hypothetical protein
MAPAELSELAKSDPAVLVVDADDMVRALASALASGLRGELRRSQPPLGDQTESSPVSVASVISTSSAIP